MEIVLAADLAVPVMHGALEAAASLPTHLRKTQNGPLETLAKKVDNQIRSPFRPAVDGAQRCAAKK